MPQVSKVFPNRFVYGTTKGAVIGLTKAIAADFVKQILDVIQLHLELYFHHHGKIELIKVQIQFRQKKIS